MLRIYKRIRQTLTHSLLAVAATSPMVLAQGLGNSPYSAQGVGELYSPGNITNMGMGDVGISNSNPFYLNLQNPALLARRTRFTVFEVGLVGQSKTISQNISNDLKSQSNFAGNLGYLALSFPANSRWNISLSLKPYTYVNYNIQRVEAVPGTPYYAEYNYTGKGGLNKATFANGFRVTKNIYLGAEASFLFGNITNSSDARAIVSTSDIRVTHLNRANYSDIVAKVGAAWRPKLNDTWTLNFGATYDPKIRIKATQTDIYQKTSLSGQAIATPDTLRLNSNAQATLPQQMHFGASIERGNTLLFGVDVGFQKWSEYRTADNKAGNLVDAMTAAAGLEYTPKPTSNRYRDLITYRAGFQYNNLPYVAANGVQLRDINGSLGISVPLGAYYVNHVTLSIAAGQRGVLSGTQIKEQYVRFGLGFSLNDLWFRKSVID
ncbi:outer membrane protein transport protein [Spirosoma pollinicola]|nr:outer membrane protein transport protein [Spirosoma pollinicola]